jgi:hypothetical protein
VVFDRAKETRGVVAVAEWFHFLLNGGEAISAAGETRAVDAVQKPTWGESVRLSA